MPGPGEYEMDEAYSLLEQKGKIFQPQAKRDWVDKVVAKNNAKAPPFGTYDAKRGHDYLKKKQYRYRF